MSQVYEQGEISLYGTMFPILGTVRRTAVTPFAGKITQGDYSRDNNIVVSSWVIQSMSGGIGIQDAVFPRDIDRFTNSTLSTPYKYITLNPYVYTAGSIGGKAELLIEYNTFLYGCVGSTVYIWSEATQAWTSEHTISGAANASAIYNGEMYIITDTGLHRYNGVTDTWTDFTSPDPYVPGGDYIIEWDGKLFRLAPNDSDSSRTMMYWSIDVDADSNGASASTDWEEAGELHLPRLYCQQLLIYFDLTGEPVIHAITRVGVYGYEFSTQKFYQTPVTFPSSVGAGFGACVWRGELHVPAGEDIYKYNGSTIQIVSPSKDDGLPAHMRGDILQIVPGHAFYYCVISTAIEGSEIGLEMQFYEDATPDSSEVVLWEETTLFEPFPMGSSSATGAVLLSPGSAWHHIFDTDVGGQMGYSLVASVEDTFRLWISTDEGVYYINLNTGLHNPLQNPDTEFREEGFLETPWVDLGWVELEKLALKLDVDADGIDTVNGTYMRIDVAYDGSEVYETIATVTENGFTQYDVGGEPGIIFRRIKLRIFMFRGDTITASPILRSVVFGFMRRPRLLWGWDVDIQLTDQPFYGKGAEELVERLYEITEEIRTAGRFVYRDRIHGILRDRRALVTNIVGNEVSGDEAYARYKISMIQLDEVANV